MSTYSAPKVTVRLSANWLLSCIYVTPQEARSNDAEEKAIKEMYEVYKVLAKEVKDGHLEVAPYDRPILKATGELHKKYKGAKAPSIADVLVKVSAIGLQGEETEAADRLKDVLGTMSSRSQATAATVANQIDSAYAKAQTAAMASVLAEEATFLQHGKFMLPNGRELTTKTQMEAWAKLRKEAIYGAKALAAEQILNAGIDARYAYIVELDRVVDLQRDFALYTKAALSNEGGDVEDWCSRKWNGRRKTYKALVFEPNPKDVGAEELNTYDPEVVLQASKDEDVLRANRAMPDEYRDLLYCLAGVHGTEGDKRDQALREMVYIHSWLAWGVQNLGNGRGVALVLHGVPGTGKGLLANIMSKVYGRYFTQIGQQQLESDFNSVLARKLFVVANEVGGEFFRDKRASANKIKGLTVGDPIIVNRKGVAEYEQSNPMNFIFFSNEYTPLVIAEDDRRFSVVRSPVSMNEAKPGLGATIAELTQDQSWIQRVVDCLWQADLTAYSPYVPLENASRAKVIEASRTPLQAWLADGLPPAGRYPNAELYRLYCQWCEETGNHALSLQTWAAGLPDWLPAGEKPVKVDGKATRVRIVPNRGQDAVSPAGFPSVADVIELSSRR